MELLAAVLGSHWEGGAGQGLVGMGEGGVQDFEMELGGFEQGAALAELCVMDEREVAVEGQGLGCSPGSPKTSGGQVW